MLCCVIGLKRIDAIDTDQGRLCVLARPNKAVPFTRSTGKNGYNIAICAGLRALLTMLWILLLILVAAIIGVLVWNRRSQAEWTREFLYLTRHQKNDPVNTGVEPVGMVAPKKISITPVMQSARELKEEAQQAWLKREQAQQAAQAAAAAMAAKRHKTAVKVEQRQGTGLDLTADVRVPEDDLNDLPIFAQTGQPPEAEQPHPDEPTAAKKEAPEASSALVDEPATALKPMLAEPEIEAAEPAAPADEPASAWSHKILASVQAVLGKAPAEVGQETESTVTSTRQAVTEAEAAAHKPDAESAVPTSERLPESMALADAAAERVQPLTESEVSAPQRPSKPADPFTMAVFDAEEPDQLLTHPAADLPVITLGEVTHRTEKRTQAVAAKPLPTVVLNTAPKQALHEAPPEREVITLPEHPVRLPRGATNTVTAAVTAHEHTYQMLAAAEGSSSTQVIQPEDIRANLLRQRLARRRDEHPSPPVQASELAVIQQDEVLANLARTDSPVNRLRHKVKQRHTVRDSVIPSAARIEGGHSVRLSGPDAEQAPISTRFTPYQRVSSATTDLADGSSLAATVTAASGFQAASSLAAAAGATAQLHVTDQPQWHIADKLVAPSADVHPIATPTTDAAPDWRASFRAAMAQTESVLAATEATQRPKPSWQQQLAQSMAAYDEMPAAADGLRPAQDIPEWQKTLNEAMAAKKPAAVVNEPTEAPLESAWTSDHWADFQIEPPSAASLDDAWALDSFSEQPSAASVSPSWMQAVQPAFVHAEPVAEAFRLPESPAYAGLSDLWGTAETVPLPGLDLLAPPQFDGSARQTEEALLENGITIEEKLAEFKVKVNVVDAYAGPVITRYEIEPAVGVRGSQVVNLEKDLARALGFASIRVVETIPGKTCMGLELPNPKRQIIRLAEIFTAPVFQTSKSKLTLALGQDITGQPVVTDLAKAPHLLVAGTTGSGKSVGVNAMILSLLFRASPEEVRLIMIDPKMLELSIYEGIPHLLAPVVTDMKLAANALTWCVNEMEKRYRLMSHLGVRNLAGYNQKVQDAQARGQRLANPFSLTPDDPDPLHQLPFIVVVVDEFADLMMTAGKKIEELIARLAQKARAAGIHLILATQRPSVDVITGLIKANIPTRVAFQVSSKIDSRTILDQMGAENLLGQGDMLFLPPGTGYPQRVHGAFVADEEVHRVVEYLKQFGEPDYVEDILTAGVGEDDLFSNANANGNARASEDDPLYDEAVSIVLKTRKASISSVQRQLRIGYNRAARLIEQMEAAGIVSAPEHSGNRTVLVPDRSYDDV